MRLRQRSSRRNKPVPQLDLFDIGERAGASSQGHAPDGPVERILKQSSLSLVVVDANVARAHDGVLPEPASREAPGPPSTNPRSDSDIRTILVDDMPSYSNLDHEMVQMSLETLPADRIWFTYSAVQQCFGVSRATIARRMKEGLIPGIRFRGANVLEDGPVRRFNRTQLHWLLLAVRTSKLQHAERSISNLRRPLAIS